MWELLTDTTDGRMFILFMHKNADLVFVDREVGG